jgi:hypothetical protein
VDKRSPGRFRHALAIRTASVVGLGSSLSLLQARIHFKSLRRELRSANVCLYLSGKEVPVPRLACQPSGTLVAIPFH